MQSFAMHSRVFPAGSALDQMIPAVVLSDIHSSEWDSEWASLHKVKRWEGKWSLRMRWGQSQPWCSWEDSVSQGPWLGPLQLRQLWLPECAFAAEERGGSNCHCPLSSAFSMSCMLRSASASPRGVDSPHGHQRGEKKSNSISFCVVLDLCSRPSHHWMQCWGDC